MITARQCRAARGLIGYTQAELAEAAGLSKTGLNNFESGKSSIKTSTQGLLKSALENLGVIFTEDEGVRLCKEKAMVFNGERSLDDLWDKIFSVFKNKKGEVLISNINEAGATIEHESFIEKNLDQIKRHGIDLKILCESGRRIQNNIQKDYRAIGIESFEYCNSKIIFDDHVAIKVWKDNTIVLLSSRTAANQERQNFLSLWQKAEKI